MSPEYTVATKRSKTVRDQIHPSALLSLGAVVLFAPQWAVGEEPYGYQVISTPGSGYSEARGLSGDGTVMIGFYTLGHNNAFRWDATGGVQAIHRPGWTTSLANDANRDGSIIVGSWENTGVHTAFFWTEPLGVTNLPTLGGNSGYAKGISSDGTVIVGETQLASGTFNAVRWENGIAQGLGTLGGNTSGAQAVSGDGLVIVGSSDVSGNNHAFRWVSGTMSDLGTLGGTTSFALDTSANGSVVVGHAKNAQNQTRAFRWEDGAMVDLGTLGGNESRAFGVSADGSVVVGQANLSGSAVRAYRWTSAGMLSVEDWLRAAQITVVNDFTETANAVSDDGSIVAGVTMDGQPFIARLAPPNSDNGGGSGVIDIEDFNATLVAHPKAQPGLLHASTVLHGAHGEPMRNLLDAGRQSLSVTGDTGYGTNGGFGIGDIGYGIGLDGGITARLASGGVHARHDITTGGDFVADGFYIAPEVSLPLFDGLHATIGGYYSAGSIDVNRGYQNGGALDYSRGKAGTEVWGAKLRLDWLNAVTVADTSFTPYLSLTYANASIDGYTETGGGFPVVFNAATEHATVARLGFDMVSDFSDTIRLTGKLEASYRFEEKSAATSGTIIGLSSFNLEGGTLDQLGLRAGIGAEFDIGNATTFVSANVTLQGQDATSWLKSGVRFTF